MPHQNGQIKKRVGLLFGGRSGEHEVSLASAMSVYQALDKSLYDVTLIAIDKDGRWLLPDPKPILSLAGNPMAVKFSKHDSSYGLVPYPSENQLISVRQGPPPVNHFDVILPILHGTYGEDGTIQGLLELADIPYVGSGVLGSAVGMDKDVAARLFSQAGIAVVPYVCVRKQDFVRDSAAVIAKLAAEFKFPFFVKPANAGSSVGVHKVKREGDIAPALRDAFSFDTKVMAQVAVNARELEVAVLGNDDPRASVVGEIVPHHEFYSYEAKYLDENGAELRFPAKDVPPEVADKVRAWAVLAFRAIECRGMARVDFFWDRDDGRVFINEINTIPGFTSISMYPKLWEATGLKYSELLNELIRLAMEHKEERKALRTTYDPSK